MGRQGEEKALKILRGLVELSWIVYLFKEFYICLRKPVFPLNGHKRNY